MTAQPRILTLDIETSPNLAHVWGLFDQNVGLNQLLESTEMLGFGAKWHDSPTIKFYSNFHHGHDEMVQNAYDMMSAADIIVHYNGKTFDMPHLRREFINAGFKPNPPVAEIDLYQICKRRFKFPSNKLQYVADYFGVGEKASTGGHELWIQCMAGNPRAWATMKRYCSQDVRITEAVYDHVRGWIPNHPHMGLYVDSDNRVCPTCGSENLYSNGFRRQGVQAYRRLQCQDCGAWSREAKSVATTPLRNVA